ncbi:bifunctional nitrate reductase/sulfite reductase flavoprotein subunit alpha [Streptomyces tanashiensis]
MGGREMGYMGPGLPGQRSVLVDDERAFVERLWDIPEGSLRTEAGSGTIGDVRRGWPRATSRPAGSSAPNPAASVANRKTVIAGLEAAELVVTQDVFAETETYAYADVVLPAALWRRPTASWSTPSGTSPSSRGVVDPPGRPCPTRS